MQEIEIIKQRIAEAELLLIGIGEKFILKENAEEIKRAYQNLATLIKGKNYFIITTCKDEMIFEAELKADRIVRPLVGEEGWEIYMKWLQGTLNKKLLVLELGVGLKYPDVIRFPFEKVTYFNQKAELIRVHDRLFQLPAELVGRGSSMETDPLSLLTTSEI